MGEFDAAAETHVEAEVEVELLDETVVVPKQTEDDVVERVVGICKWYDDKKGFGFITRLSSLALSEDGISTDRSHDVFVHVEELRPKLNIGWKCIYTGEYLEFTPSTDEHGRPRATTVTGLNYGTLLCDYGQIKYNRYYYRQFKSRGVTNHGEAANATVTPTTLGDVRVGDGSKRRRRRGRRGGAKRRKITAIQTRDTASVSNSVEAPAIDDDAATV